MTNLITPISDPSLWEILHELYIASYSGHVISDNALYKVVHVSDGYALAFKKIETLDYLDSRSIRGGKKATYRNLRNQSDID